MKKRSTYKKWLAIGVGLVFSFPQLSTAQDIHFSEMEFSPLTLNPALAGANYDLVANINYRSQWNSVAVPYQTLGASVSSRLNPKNKRTKKVYLAAGLDFFNDRSGSAQLMTNHINLHFATHLLLDKKSSIGLGIYGGWGQRAIDPSRSTWGNQYDGKHYNPGLPSGELFKTTSFSAYDVGAGMVYTFKTGQTRMEENDSKHINAGFAVFHLNRPNYSFLNPGGERLYMRFTGFVNGSFGVPKTKLLIEPGIYYFRQGPASEIYLGTYFTYKLQEQSDYTLFVNKMTASLGIFYRNKDAITLKALFQWQGIGLGFAYDINTFNSLVGVSKGKGAWEFALRYLIPDYSRRAYISGGRSFF